MIPIANTAPTRNPPLMTWALIAANCLIFLFQSGLSPAELELFIHRFALIPARYFAHLPFGDVDRSVADYLPFLTNMFLHAGWLHLIFNMWTLWLFGPAVEDRLGSLPYLFFFLACGVYIGLWFIIQLMQGTAELFLPTGGAGIAWWAHIGGFLAGLVLGPLLVQSRGRFRQYYADEGVLGFTPTGGTRTSVRG
jgi:membrane associated rhomboid family serine protease